MAGATPRATSRSRSPTCAEWKLWPPGCVTKALIGFLVFYWSLSLAEDPVIVILSPNIIVTVNRIPSREETFVAYYTPHDRSVHSVSKQGYSRPQKP